MKGQAVAQGWGDVWVREKDEPVPKGFSFIILKSKPAGQSVAADVWPLVFI